MNEAQENGNMDDGARPVSCEDIQSVLFDYMTRELGAARSDLVREHVRKCADCQKEAAEIQATLDLLQRAASEEDREAPARLSERRRALVKRAIIHPVLDWMYRHHIVVSLIVALVVIALTFRHLLSTGWWERETPESGPVVTIGNPSSNPVSPGVSAPETSAP